MSQDIFRILIFAVIATLITIWFRTSLLISTLLYFGVPSVYIICKNPGIALKSLAFVIPFSIPLSLFADALAAYNGSWLVPQSIFPLRIFGLATIEVYIFGLLWGLWVVLFYEHYFDNGKRADRLSKRIKYLWLFFLILVLTVSVMFFEKSEFLSIPYFYLWVGVVFVIFPLILFLFKYPEFCDRYFVVSLFSFPILLMFELAALYAGQWVFPGNGFIGFINIIGFRFPIEELIIWMILATPSFLVYYEYFADDTKLGTKHLLIRNKNKEEV
ncbi:MAG: hypothetical protein HZB59_06815 [Ignavibacteriales bacterium]|nr:hypothetical protein [Ignavibacteriales bacterium]